MRRAISFVLIVLLPLIVLGWWRVNADAAKDVLSDPVAMGAWLYGAHCKRCHGDYRDDRFGSDYDDNRDLEKSIENRGCRISWGRRFGGKLDRNDIKALAEFIMTWEELDGPPELPELPPPPEEKIIVPKPAETKKATEAAEQTPEDAIPKPLKVLMENNHVAHGAWLYVQECYRCHLDYVKARSGRGLAGETIKSTVANGKTSTQMKPFSRMMGGTFSNKDINDVLAYITTWEKFGEPPALPSDLLEAPELDPALLLPVSLPVFPLVDGDKIQGRKLFIKSCARCHGVDGEGYIGPRLAKVWWSTRPDLVVKSYIKQGVPGSPMKAWSTNSGGPLSAKDIEDAVSFVLSLRKKSSM